MKRYRIVAWYVADGSNQRAVPFSRVVEVEAKDRDEADRLGTEKLDAIYKKEGVGFDFLNWFIEEVK